MQIGELFTVNIFEKLTDLFWQTAVCNSRNSWKRQFHLEPMRKIFPNLAVAFPMATGGCLIKESTGNTRKLKGEIV